QIFARPLQWWPHPVQWDNVLRALHYPGFPFLRFLWNSVFYAGCVSLGTVLSCAAVGYGFARLHFPGRDLLFAITVSTMLIPGVVIFIPTFLLFKYLGLLGTYAPLICPAFLGNAFFIFLLRQFFLGLPQELSDAARVDGAAGRPLFLHAAFLPGGHDSDRHQGLIADSKLTALLSPYAAGDDSNVGHVLSGWACQQGYDAGRKKRSISRKCP